MTRQQPSDDDGRTIADMSALDGLREPEAIPGVARWGGERERELDVQHVRDVREELGDPDDRRALVFGATMAGLSIGLVYIVAFAVVILLMLALWRS